MATLQERAANKEQRDLANRRTLEAIKAKKQETDIQFEYLVHNIQQAKQLADGMHEFSENAYRQAKRLNEQIPMITGTELFKHQYNFLDRNTRAMIWLSEMLLDAINIVLNRINKMLSIIEIMK